jgi:glycosyltransferase involved in cell wall biosynthesis
VVVTSRFAGDGPVGDAPTRRYGEPLLWYHRALAGRGGRSPEEVVAPPGRIRQLVIDALAIPDLHLGWAIRVALPAARLARSSGAAAIFSTSPPQSCHLAALAVHRLTGLPWVAELRDGWTFEGLADLDRFRHRRRIEERLEAAVARRAALVGVTRPIADDLERRFGAATWIPNGFDDEEISQSAWEEARSLVDGGVFTLVYTGALTAGKRTRTADTFVRAMRLVNGAEARPPVRLVVLGRLYPDEAHALSSIPGCCVLPPRPRPVALALQRLADALLLVTAPGEISVATGKLFEYLGARRPILALADGNEAAALVRELRAGVCVPPDDPDAVARAIRALAEGNVPPPPSEDAIAPFHRRAITARLAALLDDVASGAPSHARPRRRLLPGPPPSR